MGSSLSCWSEDLFRGHFRRPRHGRRARPTLLEIHSGAEGTHGGRNEGRRREKADKDRRQLLAHRPLCLADAVGVGVVT